MTIEELENIDRALSLLVVADGCSADARTAALRFNSRLAAERLRFEGVRAAHQQARPIAPELEVELRASAAMFTDERERIVRLWRIPQRRDGIADVARRARE